ncbi:MAG TPA: SOS response-associated peptidase, partial [Gemmataceae bacterium]|nr:SOS response-associated peptidase [Gemmataceae bacterium]
MPFFLRLPYQFRMCGRYSLTKGIDEISAGLGVLPLELQPRYNIAPTQEAPVVLHDHQRQIKLLRWGLAPAWAKDESIAFKTINARAESVATTASFREAFKLRRCLILAD